ncbi:hypothetical protein HPP92_017756 [Vanilla planifolia]|uniref:Uncharacterized protein n=1 Tax=Vanilla planifolia TaxID=51239 RepID=A0A835Q4K5_VANPL|nr:hypothetical protein HPP92_017756 [Vanilla planifolia]
MEMILEVLSYMMRKRCGCRSWFFPSASSSIVIRSYFARAVWYFSSTSESDREEHGNRLGRWRSVARLRALAAPAILCPEHTAVRQSNVLTAFGDRGDQPLASRSSSTTEVEPTRTSSSSCAASQPHSAAAADEGSVKRSQSVAAVRIDEDKPHEF